MNSPKSLLQKQLEQQRFLHGVHYVEQAAQGIKKINSNELAHLNQIMTGSSDEPWRFQPVQVQIPNGQLHSFNVVSNPIQQARDIIGTAMQKSGNGDVIEGAAYIYAELVLKHLFLDANRRTAVLATLWILLAYQKTIKAQELLDIPIGDLRNPQDFAKLSAKIKSLSGGQKI